MVGPVVGSARGLGLVLFGDGRWAADTVEQLASGQHRVLGVVLRRRPTDASLADAARRLGIPTCQPSSASSSEFREWIARLAPDVNLSIAYDQIIREPLLHLAPRGFVNIHAGMLPAYRGRNVVNWAILNGEAEIGLTSHFMDDGIDTGDILVQRSLPIAWTDGYGEVLERVMTAVPGLARETLDGLLAGVIRPRAQDHSRATYYGGRQEGDEWLDWSAPSVELHNKVRGITRPAPGARTLLGGRPLIIWRAYYDPSWPRYTAIPGQVVGRQPGVGVVVKTGDSTLLVTEVQPDGGDPMLPDWPLGTRLGPNLAGMFHDREQRGA